MYHGDELAHLAALFHFLRDCKLDVKCQVGRSVAKSDLTVPAKYTMLHIEVKNALSAAIIIELSRPDDTILAGWYAQPYSPNGDILETCTRENSEWFKKHSMVKHEKRFLPKRREGLKYPICAPDEVHSN